MASSTGENDISAMDGLCFVSIPYTIDTTRLPKSLTFDLPLQYNPHQFGWSSYSPSSTTGGLSPLESPTDESRIDKMPDGVATDLIGRGYSPYHVSIPSIVDVIWLLGSLTFDLPPQDNPQEYGSSGHSTPSSSSDTPITSTNKKPRPSYIGGRQRPSLSHTNHGQEQKQYVVYQQQQKRDPPQIAAKTEPYISGTDDPDLDNTLRTPDPIHETAADVETQPSQDSINALDKGGHMWHYDQNPG